MDYFKTLRSAFSKTTAPRSFDQMRYGNVTMERVRVYMESSMLFRRLGFYIFRERHWQVSVSNLCLLWKKFQMTRK